MSFFTEKRKKLFFLVMLAALTLVSAWYISVCTKYAPWGFSDSATYLSAARNLAAGKGLGTFNPDGTFSPLLIFAPFFSIFLSFFAVLKIDLVSAIGILDIFFFSALVFGTGWIFYQLTRSWWASLCLALMVAATPTLVTYFTSMMSEPLAIVLGFLGFLLIPYSIKQNSNKCLIISAILTGLALLTRYAFIAFPMAGISCLLLLSSNPLRQRLINSLKYTLISLSSMAVWIIVQLTSRTSIGSRHYALGFSLKAKLSEFFSQVYAVIKYWLPYRTNMLPGIRAEVFKPILLTVFVGVILLGLFLSFKQRSNPNLRFSWLIGAGFGILILFYGAVLLLTFCISKELISLDDRMLSPIIPMFYGLLLVCALNIDRLLHPKFNFPLIVSIIAICFVVFNYPSIRSYPSGIGKFPNGYTSSIWKENPFLDGTVNIPINRPIISNAPDILLFYKNQSAYYLSRDAASGDSSISIRDQSGLSKLMSRDCAVMVLFDPNTADRFERLSNSITDQDIKGLETIYQNIHSSPDGILLEDENCQK